MNIHDLYESGMKTDILDFTAQFAFRTESSASFDLFVRTNDSLQIGWVDVHHPCQGFIKAKIRVCLPEDDRGHDFERMRDFVQRLFLALGIPADETFEADFFCADGAIRYENATDRHGSTDRMY